LAASAGLPEAVEDGGTQGCLRCAERRQDGRRDRLVHGDEGERELLDADVVVVTRPGLAERVPQRSLACRVKREVPDGGSAGLAYGRQRRGLPSAQRPGHRALRPGWPVSRQASGAARVKASGPDAASIRGCTARTIPVPARSRPGASPAVTWVAAAPLPHAAQSPGRCWRRLQRVQASSPAVSLC